MNRPITTRQSAFTLIELSIVLVIIALVGGAILVGRDMIQNATILAQISQLQSFQTAHNTFKIKYGCTAGDCPNAEQFWVVAVNGDGDQLIENHMDMGYNYESIDILWSASIEYQQYFIQLGEAGLIPGSYDGSKAINRGAPALKYDANSVFFAADYRSYKSQSNNSRTPSTDDYSKGLNSIWLVGCNLSASDKINVWDRDCGIFAPADLKNIDTKIDDGKPTTGHLIAFSGDSKDASKRDCLMPDLIHYKLTQTEKRCQAAMVLD